MASDQLFLSSGPLLKSLLNPIAFSLLCPIAFSACSSFKSMLPLLPPLASFPKSMPPLLRRFASSPEPTPPISSPKPPLLRLVGPPIIAFSAYRSFNPMPAFSAHRLFSSMSPLLRPATSSPNSSPLLRLAAPSLIAFYAYRSFNSVAAFSAYRGFINSIRPVKALSLKDKYNRRADLVEIIHTKDNLLFRVSMPGQCIEDVKIFKYQNTFVVRAEDNHCTRSILAADITGTFCNIDKIEAEMKGSNLEIVIPTYNIP